MPVNCTYGFGCDVNLDFDQAIEKVTQILNEKGFQIYSQINLHEIMEGVDHDNFGRYIIIGACNTEFAQQLFLADPNIGLLMPCNVVVYENMSGGCRVMIKDPVHIMDMIKNPVAIAAAINVKCLLEEVIEELDG